MCDVYAVKKTLIFLSTAACPHTFMVIWSFISEPTYDDLKLTSACVIPWLVKSIITAKSVFTYSTWLKPGCFEVMSLPNILLSLETFKKFLQRRVEQPQQRPYRHEENGRILELGMSEKPYPPSFWSNHVQVMRKTSVFLSGANRRNSDTSTVQSNSFKTEIQPFIPRIN